jgi:hypothetical protein
VRPRQLNHPALPPRINQVYQCDLSQPHCLRCIQDGHQCEGYQRTRHVVFVRHEPDKFAHGSLKIVRPSTRSGGKSRIAPQSRPTTDLVTPHRLVSAALGDQVLAAWWNAYLPSRQQSPKGSLLIVCQSKLWSSGWAETVSNLSTESPLLRKALRALALSSKGGLENDESIAREGVKFYGEAVTQLNAILQDPEHAASNEAVLPTCLLLSHYEVS